MNELKNRAVVLKEKLSGLGADKFSYCLTENEKTEFNLENGEFSLMRTVFGKKAELSVFRGLKKGVATGNDLSEEGLDALAQEAIASAESSEDDECNDIAPFDGEETFKSGNDSADMDTFFRRVKELLTDISEEYPKILVMSVVASCDKEHSLYENSNGTSFDAIFMDYSVILEFAGNDGENTTGFFFDSFTMHDPDVKLIDCSEIRKNLQRAEESLKTVKMPGKFEGTVLFTPGCAAQFIYMTLENYISSSVIIDGTSLWKDKLDQKVASEKLTVSLKTSDDRIVKTEFWTADGYKNEDLCLIDKGVLKSFMLSLYASKKTGNTVAKNSGDSFVIEGGEKTFDEIIGSIDKGLLVGSFSGGEPGANGEFSGVAKNAFYIEGGRIVGAVTETMINGNLGDVLNNIVDISKEQICDGSMAVPYIAAKGIVISGK